MTNIESNSNKKNKYEKFYPNERTILLFYFKNYFIK